MNKTQTKLPKAVLVPVAKIRIEDQPRTYFDEEKLAELRDSISQHGLKNPIFVKPDPAGDGYILVAGERRLRCVRTLGMEQVPAFIETDQTDALVWQIIENTQRENLNAIEEARGYARLRDERGLSQAQIATLTSKKQPHVSQRLALLKLPDDLQDYVAREQLSIIHGVTLVRRCESPAEMSAIVKELGAKYGSASRISHAALEKYLDERDRRKELQGKHIDPTYAIPLERARSLAAGSANLLALLSDLVGEEGTPPPRQEAFRARWTSIPRVERTKILSLLRSLAGRLGVLVDLLKREDQREVEGKRV